MPGPHPPCIRRGWEAMDIVNLQEELRGRVRCLQGVPSFLRGQFRSASVASLEAMREAYSTGDHLQKWRIWKVFRLTSRIILWRKQLRGPTKSGVGKKNGPLPETEVCLVFGGGKTQRHRIAVQAQPIVTRRVGPSRSPSGEVCSPRRSVTCPAGFVFSGQSSRHCSHLERAPRPRGPTRLSEAIPEEVSRFGPQHLFELDQAGEVRK